MTAILFSDIRSDFMSAYTGIVVAFTLLLVVLFKVTIHKPRKGLNAHSI